jgi:hypothetical protein
MPTVLTLSSLADKTDLVYLQPPIPAKKRSKIVQDDSAAVKPRKMTTKIKQEPLWLRRKEAIAFLGTRSVLEAAERSGWLKAAVRQPRLVLYNRQEVLACAYRLSQGEYPD